MLKHLLNRRQGRNLVRRSPFFVPLCFTHFSFVSFAELSQWVIDEVLFVRTYQACVITGANLRMDVVRISGFNFVLLRLLLPVGDQRKGVLSEAAAAPDLKPLR